MRLRRALRIATLLTTALLARPLLAKDGPTFHTTKLNHFPYNLNYFEDSDVVLFQDDASGTLFRSEDAGASWNQVTSIPDGKALQLVMHEFDPTRAYVLTPGIRHFRTSDRGKTWHEFLVDAEMSIFRNEVLNFHASDPDRIIFNGMDCQGIFCDEVTMFTTDGFSSDAKLLRGSTSGCWWAKSSKLFTTGDEAKDKQRILCVVRDEFSPFKQDQRLLVSDNYFKAVDQSGVIQEFEPDLDTNRPVQGIVNVAVVKSFLLVAATSQNTDEMALFVTDDTLKWHRAVFPTDHKINQEAYTVLESTNYSIQIDVLTTSPSNPMGVLFTSNSNGTFFTRNVPYTNRNHHGHVDFEKIAGIQGIFLVNEVANGEDIEKDHHGKKRLVTKITFDDGRTFDDITADKERLHLHSVTEINNVGRVYSSPAPGLVMANGNTGESLGSVKDASLFISDNAGVTWIKGPKGPYKYEFGDQGSVLLAIKDSEAMDDDNGVSEITYSLNHGKDWTTAALPDNLKVQPIILTTTQDSTSIKFILVAQDPGNQPKNYYIVYIDFDGLHEATCTADDMEEWFARVDDKGNPTCLMGHTERYNRRKKDANCFIKKEFKEALVETANCDCTPRDFECDYNFELVGDKCEAVGPIAAPEGACRNAKADDVFQGSSGWRLIPGNTCKRTSGKQLDEPVERKCQESTAPPVSPPTGKISSTQTEFKGDWTNFEKHYLEKGDSSSDADETIVSRPFHAANGKGGEISLTRDHGKTWEQPSALHQRQIWAIMTHQYFKEMAFFIQESGEVIYTVDRGAHFHDFTAPTPVDPSNDGPLPLVFHPDKKDWLIWLGRKCDKDGGGECYIEAFLSKDRGDRWDTIARYVRRCEFTGSSSFKWRPSKQILCLVKEREGSERDIPWQLVASDDFFETQKVPQKNVKDFATMAEFIVVASELPDKQSLQAFASLDGQQYKEVEFPQNFVVTRQHAYTVLDSSTHAVNLFVPTDMDTDHKFGTIIKSNSNGTSYVVSISGVNCDDNFYVDFEKMLGLEGVILVNTVANRDRPKEPKKKQTMISHNDGAEWSYLPPPEKDAAGNAYTCSSAKGDANCALHVHGYTERQDHRRTYSSAGAVGLMFAIGNVGPVLGDNIKEADTFMTTDAGISWRSVKKGPWTWAYGDQGSIVVLVPRQHTNMVSYTTDEGATWADYQFLPGADDKVEVLDISTVGSGASRNFLLWCRRDKGGVFTVNLDFAGLTNKPCEKYDVNKGDENDYYIWSPKHPMQDNDCLFGHISEYLRKKTDRQCYNGYKLAHLFGTEVCECQREDFECDYNFELREHRECRLVDGLEPISKEEWCGQHPDAWEFHEPTGYRRIPLSTCRGGYDMTNFTESSACKGHEEEYERHHRGPGGFVVFLAVAASVGGAAAVGWFVWRQWMAGHFGQIRLGEHPSERFRGGDLFDTDRPWVRYPVVALSATVAVVGAIPLLVGALWRTASQAAERWGFGGGRRGAYSGLPLNGSGRFTTRDSFARGTGDYAGVDEDEGELLGDESDDEV